MSIAAGCNNAFYFSEVRQHLGCILKAVLKVGFLPFVLGVVDDPLHDLHVSYDFLMAVSMKEKYTVRVTPARFQGW